MGPEYSLRNGQGAVGEGRPSARRDSEGGSWGAACASSKRATEEGRGVPLQAEPTPRSLQAQKARLARPRPRGGARPVGHLAPRAPRFPRHARHARRTPGPFHRCWGLHPTPPNGSSEGWATRAGWLVPCGGQDSSSHPAHTEACFKRTKCCDAELLRGGLFKSQHRITQPWGAPGARRGERVAFSCNKLKGKKATQRLPPNGAG